MVLSDQDVNAFLDSVSEVSRLIDGLKAGAISPEYVDTKIAQKSQQKAGTNKPIPSDAQAPAPQAAAGQDAAATDTARQAELMRKVEELKTSRQRKLKARQLYESYVQGKQKQQHSYATDYNKWELWCPSDDEDDLFNSLTPNSPQFRAMEQDISARHARMVEQRQIAERQRQLGNAAFKAGQFSEALRCYEVGLEAQRHNMTLHANAAMAALKLKCFVTAQEHCDKVLHLAEVLHNTPKHALCVKALRRRAAAYQGLEQYSKAVADLQAAADILPGDAEVTEQLQRAQVLLKEHKTVKQLARLPTAQQASPGATEPTSASSAGACTTDSSPPSVDKHTCSNSTSTTMASSSNGSSTDTSVRKSSTTDKDMADVLRLQRIKQLTTTLVETCSKAATDSLPAVQACDELQGLVAGTQYSLFFRKCGGLEAASKLVLKSNDAAAQAVGLQLLNTVCDCDTAVEQLSEQLLGAILDLIASQQGVAAEAALELAYSASICNTVRTRLCVQLVKEPPQQPPQQQLQAGKSRLVSMWDLCCKVPTSGRTTTENMQVLAISLISNCMLVATARAALADLLQQAEGALDSLAAQLGSCGPGFAVKVLGLLSNMCNHAALRAQLADCKQLMQQVLQSACRAVHVHPVTEQAVSALGCLCNLALEQSVQQLLCTRKGFVVQLVRLATAGPDCSAAFKESCSSDANTSSSSHGSGGRTTSVAGLQLPPRAKDKHSKGASSLPGAAETAAVAGAAGVPLADHSCLSARAASLLSRVAKQAVGVEVLQQQGALGAYADAISALLSRPLATSGQTAEQLQQQAQQSKDAAETSQLAAQWLAAAVRTMALLTAVPDLCSSCSTGHAAAAIQSCCQVLRSSECEDAVRGNAALVVKGFAGASDHRWHAQLAEADAVQALIAAARSGRGNPSSRNAGIALALLARCGGVFIERVRELRGLEVLHQYVRP